MTFQIKRDEYVSRSIAAIHGRGFRNFGVLQQSSYRQYFFGALLYCTVPYRRHVINPLNLWAPNARLKERKDLI